MRHPFSMLFLIATLWLGLAGCEPSGQRPGITLGGEPAPFETDWTFTQEIPEIAIQITTPYFITHAVTIWCGSMEGRLYVAAGAPETKRWPGWVADDPNVSLQIGEKRYEGVLELLTDRDEINRIQKVYAAKYNYPEPDPLAAPTTRFWRVRAAP